MGYDGEQIQDFVDRAATGAKLAGQHMATEGTERFQEVTKDNTPVDTLHLRDDIDKTPVIYVKKQNSYGQKGWEGKVRTFTAYAPEMEKGSGLWGPHHKKFIIKPRKPGGVLAFSSRIFGPEGRPVMSEKAGENLAEGNMVFTNFVEHPGSPGHHMFAIGAAMAEAEIPTLGNRGMRVMRNYTERRA
jgi:hypothetical protein